MADGLSRTRSPQVIAISPRWSRSRASARGARGKKRTLDEPAGVPNVTRAQLFARTRGTVRAHGPRIGRAGVARARRRPHARRTQRLAEWREVFGERLAVEVQLHHAGGEEAALAGALIDLAERVWRAVGRDERSALRGRVVAAWCTTCSPRCGTRWMSTRRCARACCIPTASGACSRPPTCSCAGRGAKRGYTRARASPRISNRSNSPGCGRRFRSSTISPAATPTISCARARSRARMCDGAPRSARRRNEQIDHELASSRSLGFAGFFLVMWDAVSFAHSRRHPLSGPRQRGELGRHLLPRHHRGGSGEGGTAVRAVSFRSARRRERRGARYRRGLRARPARRSARLHVRQVQASACGDRLHRADIPRAERGAGRHARVRISRGAGDVDFVAAAPLRSGRRSVHMQEQVRRAGRARARLHRVYARCCARSAGFEGLPRLRATHVGGFVLSSGALGDWMPVEQTTMGRTIVQFDKDDLDAVGVPKLDFLGLGGLAMVSARSMQSKCARARGPRCTSCRMTMIPRRTT